MAKKAESVYLVRFGGYHEVLPDGRMGMKLDKDHHLVLAAKQAGTVINIESIHSPVAEAVDELKTEVGDDLETLNAKVDEIGKAVEKASADLVRLMQIVDQQDPLHMREILAKFETFVGESREQLKALGTRVDGVEAISQRLESLNTTLLATMKDVIAEKLGEQTTQQIDFMAEMRSFASQAAEQRSGEKTNAHDLLVAERAVTGDLRNQIELLTERLVERDARIGELEGVCRERALSIHNLNEKVAAADAATAEHQTVREENIRLEQLITRLSKADQVETLRSQLIEEGRRHQAAMQQRDEEVAQLTEQIANLREELNKKGDGAMSEELNRAQAQVRQLTEELARMTSQFELVRNQATTMSASNLTQSAEITRLTSQIAAKTAEIEAAKTARAQAESAKLSAETNLGVRTAEVVDLRTRLDNETRARQAAEAATPADVAQLRRDLDTKTSRVTTLEGEVAAKSAELNSKTADLSRETTRANTLQGEADALRLQTPRTFVNNNRVVSGIAAVAALLVVYFAYQGAFHPTSDSAAVAQAQSDAQKYRTEATTAKDAQVKAEDAKAKADTAKANAEAAKKTAEDTLAPKDREIGQLNKTLAEKEQKIADLTNARPNIAPPGTIPATPSPGVPQAIPLPALSAQATLTDSQCDIPGDVYIAHLGRCVAKLRH
jgi:ribosomal protein S15P/S13E